MNEYIVREHLADLRRDARAHSRVASRADRAVPRVGERVTARLYRRPAAVGCEA